MNNPKAVQEIKFESPENSSFVRTKEVQTRCHSIINFKLD